MKDLPIEVKEKYIDLQDSFDAVAQPRSDYQLEHFVVKDHETQERQFLQVVIELQAKSSVLRRAVVNRRKLMKRIKAEQDADEKELLLIDLEDLDFGMKGAVREFNTLYGLYAQLPRFTAEDIQKAEADYWRIRLTRQAAIDVEATGRIGTGNLNALRQADLFPTDEKSKQIASALLQLQKK